MRATWWRGIHSPLRTRLVRAGTLACLVVTGVRLKTAALRWQGLALFGATTLKVFVFDLAYLSGVYRIASSVALGLVLLIVSFLYQKSLVARRSAQENQP